MAGFGGFLQGLGLAIGNDMIQGQNYQNKQADIELKKTEVQQAQMQQQQMQQQMKTQKDIGAFIKSQTDLEGADAALPMNQAKMYSKAAGLAASQGDLASAKEMTDLSKQATQEGVEQTKALAVQQAQKKEALANIADNTPEQPTREQSNALVKAAVEAGTDPTTIPMPGTPAFLTWKNEQKMAGMDSAKKAEFVQKAADIKMNRDMKWQEHTDNVDLRRATMQQTASFREAQLGMERQRLADSEQARKDRSQQAPSHLETGGAIWEFDPDMKLKSERNANDPRYAKLGNKVSTTQENNTVATGKAAANVSRDLDQMGRFPTGTANSPFAHITDHDFLSSIEKVGSNALTPEQIQMFGTSTGGMSTELGRVLTIGAGRGANQSLINEVKTFTTPNAGDTNLEAAYKMATAAQMVKTTMENTPPPNDQSVKKGWDATLAKVSSFPSPEEILKAASGPQRKQLATLDGTYTQLLGKVQDAVTKNNSSEPLPGGGDVGAGTNAPPLPAGFTLDK
jgi:hypothetical protein